jgi:mannose-6-phosphate isomerase-like protein (cupin superfamily)
MLRTGDVIENPVMGQRILFCKLASDTQGAFSEVEYFNKPFTGRGTVAAHFHPAMTERFEILAGRARYRLDKQEHEVQPGDLLTFPRRVPHLHPWSISAEELHVRQTTFLDQPDSAVLELLGAQIVTLFGLARDGKVDKAGMPNPLQGAVLMHALMPHVYLDGMPVLVQELVFGVLAGVGRRLGYCATYPQYGGA